ncbi:transcriptional repressor LexA [Brachyspira pilosicoli]|uniref:LexA repressor n=5 Tax=Brachyspira pilosicoli TaxID=52584 RepID=D8IF41_BRAP9|nr:transcriptional repressor LexA [Brachyspira pilosicoli]ADK31764.1 LexA repressor [Brachyspira pilosicoli 95/1000]MBW5377939.1 repressor LexA [Brachyspira pilosicoli]MBW5382906.1 repressor LexA [Brachyspira pilosicoli]MBW5392410.1 repressor LexA [Brachyspira pilosicoli]MBW5400286.1 repressor LexA [Brachyspira pilosicoli]
MTELTDKQKHILNFLQKFMNENGYPPTVKEIMVHFNFASPTAVTTHLTALEKKGYVKKTGKRARGSVPINTVEKKDNLIKIPLLTNEVKAGLLMDVSDESYEDFFPLPESIAQNENNFLMKVKGDSMIDAHIKEGDMVLVNPSNIEPQNGDIVVAKIDDNGDEEITIKRFFKEKDCIKLVAENKEYPPIIQEKVSIVGKVVGLIRLKI